jgi:hypothetical protein
MCFSLWIAPSICLAASLEMPRQHVNFPTLIPPLNPLLNPPPAINGINVLMPANTYRQPPPQCSLAPYKRQAPPSRAPRTFPLALELSLALLRTCDDFEPPSLRCLSAIAHPLVSTPSAPPCRPHPPHPPPVSSGEP